MELEMLTKVINEVEKCPVCGDTTIGSGSRFDVDCDNFERVCRCGWKIKGEVKDGKIIITHDNRNDLIQEEKS